MEYAERLVIEGRTEGGYRCTVVVEPDDRERDVLYLHGARGTSLVLTDEVRDWLADVVLGRPVA